MTKQKHINELEAYRRRMRFSQQEVSELANMEDRSLLSRYERGEHMPTLMTALALEIIYRIPIAFCYPQLYSKLRDEIRSREARIALRTAVQPVLF